eukprot:scaffold76281_cov61-Attheya_sp.AAC.1
MGSEFCILDDNDLSNPQQLLQVLRPEFCAAYCDSWLGCDMFTYNMLTLQCHIYMNNDVDSPLAQKTPTFDCSQGEVYLITDYSPRKPLIVLPSEICISENNTKSPQVSSGVSSFSACFKYSCEPVKCHAFRFNPSSGECIIYREEPTLVTCINTMDNAYLVTLFDYDEGKSNKMSSETLLDGQEIKVQTEKECAIICEAFQPCESFVMSEGNTKCRLVGEEATAISATGSTLYGPARKSQLTKVGKGVDLTASAMIDEIYNVRERDCLWICQILSTCVAVQFSGPSIISINTATEKKCQLFSSIRYEKSLDTNSHTVWISFERYAARDDGAMLETQAVLNLEGFGLTPSDSGLGFAAANRVECIEQCVEKNCSVAEFYAKEGETQSCRIFESLVDEVVVEKMYTELLLPFPSLPFGRVADADVGFDPSTKLSFLPIFEKKSLAECYALCDAFDVCRGFTYNARTCYLYEAPPAPCDQTDTELCIGKDIESLFKHRLRYELKPHALGSPKEVLLDLSILELAQCVVVCNAMSNCRAFEYTEGNCRLNTRENTNQMMLSNAGTPDDFEISFEEFVYYYEGTKKQELTVNTEKMCIGGSESNVLVSDNMCATLEASLEAFSIWTLGGDTLNIFLAGGISDKGVEGYVGCLGLEGWVSGEFSSNFMVVDQMECVDNNLTRWSLHNEENAELFVKDSALDQTITDPGAALQLFLFTSPTGRQALALLSKISNLERAVLPFLELVKQAGVLLTSASDIVGTTLEPISDMTESTRGVTSILNPIQKGLELFINLAKRNPTLKVLARIIKQLRLAPLLKKIKNGLVKGNDLLDKVEDKIGLLPSPLDNMQRVMSSITGAFEPYAPAYTLRVMSHILVKVLNCAEIKGQQDLSQMLTKIIRAIDRVVGEVTQILDEINEKVSFMYEKVSQARQLLQVDVGVLDKLNIFDAIIGKVANIFDRKPFTWIPELMEEIIFVLPELTFELEKKNVNFGKRFGTHEMILPKISIGGSFCIPLGPTCVLFNYLIESFIPKSFKKAIDKAYENLEDVLATIIDPIMKLLGTSFFIDLSECKTCLSVGNPCCQDCDDCVSCSECTVIRVKDVVKQLEKVVDIVDKVIKVFTDNPLIRSLQAVFDALVENSIGRLLPDVKLPIPDLGFTINDLAIIDLISAEIEKVAEEISEKMAELARKPEEMLQDVINTLLAAGIGNNLAVWIETFSDLPFDDFAGMFNSACSDASCLLATIPQFGFAVGALGALTNVDTNIMDSFSLGFATGVETMLESLNDCDEYEEFPLPFDTFFNNTLGLQGCDLSVPTSISVCKRLASSDVLEENLLLVGDTFEGFLLAIYPEGFADSERQLAVGLGGDIEQITSTVIPDFGDILPVFPAFKVRANWKRFSIHFGFSDEKLSYTALSKVMGNEKMASSRDPALGMSLAIHPEVSMEIEQGRRVKNGGTRQTFMIVGGTVDLTFPADRLSAFQGSLRDLAQAVVNAWKLSGCYELNKAGKYELGYYQSSREECEELEIIIEDVVAGEWRWSNYPNKFPGVSGFDAVEKVIEFLQFRVDGKIPLNKLEFQMLNDISTFVRAIRYAIDLRSEDIQGIRPKQMVKQMIKAKYKGIIAKTPLMALNMIIATYGKFRPKGQTPTKVPLFHGLHVDFGRFLSLHFYWDLMTGELYEIGIAFLNEPFEFIGEKVFSGLKWLGTAAYNRGKGRLPIFRCAWQEFFINGNEESCAKVDAQASDFENQQLRLSYTIKRNILVGKPATSVTN